METSFSCCSLISWISFVKLTLSSVTWHGFDEYTHLLQHDPIKSSRMGSDHQMRWPSNWSSSANAVSILQFCVWLLEECLVPQMHTFKCFLDYSHSFLIDLRPPRFWFVIHRPSFFKLFHPTVNWVPKCCIAPVTGSESPFHSCHWLQFYNL